MIPWKIWSDVWDMMVAEERINKNLATMNHASEKSKWESWRRSTKCDEEQQVTV
jgi:hypothetical protein